MWSNRKKIIVPVLFLLVFFLPQISNAALISSEDFESGASGWNDNTTDNSEAGFTQFLGRFGGSDGTQAVFKSYNLPGDQVSVTIVFDFYEIDSWDGNNEDADDSFIVFIDDSIAVNALYAHWSNDDDSDPHSTPYADPSPIGFATGEFNNDQRHQYSITVPTTANSIKLGFGSGLDQGIEDESWGIDNITINTNYEQQSIPTINEWGMILMSLILAGAAFWMMRRRQIS